MGRKYKIDSTNRQFLTIIYSFAIFYSCIYIGKIYTFPQDSKLIYLIIYMFLGLLVPMFKNYKPIKKKNIDKNYLKFSLNFALGFSFIIEGIMFYTSDFAQISKKSYMSSIDFGEFSNIFVFLCFCIVIVLYFTQIIDELNKKNPQLLTVFMCSTAFSIMYDGDIFKNFIIGFLIFYSYTAFGYHRIPVIMILISVSVNFLFESIYLTYYAFGIMHYFIFIFVVVGFVFLLKAIDIMDKILFYYKFEKKGKLIDTRILWFASLLLGIFISTYNGRF